MRHTEKLSSSSPSLPLPLSLSFPSPFILSLSLSLALMQSLTFLLGKHFILLIYTADLYILKKKGHVCVRC